MAFIANPRQANVTLKLLDLARATTATATATDFYWYKLVATHNDKWNSKNNITNIREELTIAEKEQVAAFVVTVTAVPS